MKLSPALVITLTLVIVSCIARMGAAQDPQASLNDPVILSDAHGYDFAPYLKQLMTKVRVQWYQAMPEAARQGQKGRVILIFTVLRNGAIQNLRVVANSGTQSLDQAARNAVQFTSPFSGLPADFSDNHIDLQLAFLYNQR